MITSRADMEEELLNASFDGNISAVFEAAEALRDQLSLASITDDLILDSVAEQYPNWMLFMIAAWREKIELTELVESGILTARGRDLLRSTFEKATLLKSELRALNDDELVERFNETADERKKLFQRERNERGAARDRWDFFSDPRVAADFNHWLAFPIWKFDEALALSMGKNPDTVTRESLGTLKTVYGSPFRDEYLRRTKIIKRAIEAGDLELPLRPRSFVEWAVKGGLDLPKEVVDHYPPEKKARLNSDVQFIHKNTLHTYYRVLLGVLVNHYEYDFSKEDTDDQPGVYTKIETALVNAGVEVNAKTIRKHAREARAWAREKGLPITLKHGKQRRL